MKLSIIRITVIIGILVALFFVLNGPILRGKKSASKVKTINSLRQVLMATGEFENEFGHYPNAEIPESFRKDYPQRDRADSNYILGQMIGCRLLDSEEVFKAYGLGLPRGDNIITPPSEILKAGECHIACVSKINGAPFGSDQSPHAAPVLFAYVDPATRKFDPKVYKGKAVYGKADGSASEARLDDEGNIYLKGGKTHPELLGLLWKEDKPTINYPLPYKVTPSAPESKYPGALALVVFVSLPFLLWFLVSTSKKGRADY